MLRKLGPVHQNALVIPPSLPDHQSKSDRLAITSIIGVWTEPVN